MEKSTEKQKKSGLKYWVYLLFTLLLLSTGISGLKEKPALQEKISFQEKLINSLNKVIENLTAEVTILKRDLHLVREGKTKDSTAFVSKITEVKSVKPEVKIQYVKERIPLTYVDSLSIARILFDSIYAEFKPKTRPIKVIPDVKK